MFSRFNQRKTVAEVMTAFSQTLAELKQVEEDHASEAAAQRAIADAAHAKATESENESNYARAVATKLGELISAPTDSPRLSSSYIQHGG